MTAPVVDLTTAAAGRRRCCDCGARLRASEQPAARCTGCIGQVLEEMLRCGITPRVGVLEVAGDALAVIATLPRTAADAAAIGLER